MIKIRWC